MISRDTALIWLSVRALHAPSRPSARMNPEYPSSSFVRSFICVPSTPQGVFGAGFPTHRHNLHSGVPDVSQEAIDDGSMDEKIPSGTRRLAENHMRNPLSLRELDECIGHLRALQLHDLGAQL